MAGTFKYAKEYIQLGLNPIPLARGSKNPERPGWQQERYDIDEVETCFTDDGNVGVILGNGIVDIDLDCEHARILAPYFLQETAQFGRASSEKSHWVFKVSTPLSYEKYSDSNGVIFEIRSTSGHQTVFPPSLHGQSGETVEWETDVVFSEVDGDALLKSCRMLAAAVVIRKHWRDGIRDELRTTLTTLMLKSSYQEKDVDNFINAIADSVDGEHKFKATYQLARIVADKPSFGLPTLKKLIPQDYVKVLQWLGIDQNSIEIVSPLMSIEGLCDDGTLTDLRAAYYFSSLFNSEALYCEELRKWMIYSGQRWTDKSPGGISPFVTDFIKELHSIASMAQNQTQLKALSSQIKMLESHKNQRSMLACAKGIPEMNVFFRYFDREHMKLNVVNGTINLETGRLEPHRSKDLITKIIEIDYDDTADCPVFEEFLDRVFDSNQAIISYVQRFLGYCLTGKTTEQVLLFLYGLGSNGKSTLVKIFQMLLGEYATTSKSDLLMQRKGSDNTYQLAALKGRRLVAVSEFEDGAKIAEAELKTLTGGDEIVSREIYGTPTTWTPSFKIILSGNHKPEIRGTDYGVWRRIHLVHFGVTIKPEERDPHLINKLEKELPGILAWAVRGCQEWQRIGLAAPAEVLEEVEEYKQSEDCLQQWIDVCCELDPDYHVSLKTLVESYCDYHGDKLSAKKLSKMLSEAGFEKMKSSSTQFTGLTLASLVA